MSGLFGIPPLPGGLLSRALLRPRVFVSYHHRGDQWYYNEFSRIFHDQYEAIEDRSLDRRYGSEDLDYVRWAVANNDIKGTSCTIVLCGAITGQRKFVDWEIKATLDDKHGLIGIALPTAPRAANGAVTVPDRLHANVQSGYAVFQAWEQLTVANLTNWIATARYNSQNRTSLIVNPRELKTRNG